MAVQPQTIKKARLGQERFQERCDASCTRWQALPGQSRNSSEISQANCSFVLFTSA